MTPTGWVRRGAAAVLGARILDSTNRVTAILRTILIAPLIVLALVLRDENHDKTHYLIVLGVFTAWAVFTVWWTSTRPTPSWARPASIFTDLAFFITMAATSAGATSYITPVFYLYPVFTVFYYRPLITATVGILVAGGYAAVWLDNLAIRGGPGNAGIVWMHFLLLAWMAITTTSLSLVLAHRAKADTDARTTHDNLTAQLLAADQHANTRLADNLHDGPLQNVIAARRLLEALTDSPHQQQLLIQTQDILERTTRTLRGTVADLHPQVLTHLGLETALTDLAHRANTHTTPRVTAHITTPLPLSPDSAFAVYAATRELLHNALRHAHATTITLTAHTHKEAVHITVTDDGTGINPHGPSPAELIRTGHIGLASHTLRIENLGGTLTHRHHPPHGNTATITLPTRPDSTQLGK